MKEPKVSVIVPVYNTEPYLRQCLDSIANQTLREIEILCVDDGSTDGSKEILKEYQRKDSRFIILEQQGRLGAGAARNEGLSAARGTYLSFLDSDDFFRPRMLELCADRMERDHSDVAVYSAKQYNTRTGETVYLPWSLQAKYCPKHSPFSPAEMKDFLFNAFQNWPWNKMFRRDLIENNHIRFQEIARTNDAAFVLSTLASAKRISLVRKPLACYRIAAGSSLQSTNEETPLCFWQAYQETKRRLKARGLYETYEKTFLNMVLDGSMYNLGCMKSWESFQAVYLHIQKNAEKDFHFSKYPEEFFHEAGLYRDFRQIERLSAEEYLLKKVRRLESRGGGKLLDQGNVFLRLAKGIACLQEHGLRYSVSKLWPKEKRS